jgi:hypothetical protein
MTVMLAPSAVALLTAVVEPGLGLGVVDEVQPAQHTATASEITTTKLATPIFIISYPLCSAVFSEVQTRLTHLIVSSWASVQDSVVTKNH